MKSSDTKKWYHGIPRACLHLVNEELKRGTLMKTLKKSLKQKSLVFDQVETLSGLLERQALEYPSSPFIYFKNQCLSFRQVNDRTNQVANYLDSYGYGSGDGVGIMMKNCPEFLFVYYATQRIGTYVVPINNALVGEGLEYILAHSEIKVLFIDQEFVSLLNLKHLPQLEKIVVRQSDQKLKPPFESFQEVLQFYPDRKNSWKPKLKDISTIMYTSGTTGRPKGVVFKYSMNWVRRMGAINHLIYKKDDVLYTCLPLFHANALCLSFSAALWLGIPIVLSEKFSASKFWKEIKQHRATVFNSIGAMIPILLKTPPCKDEKSNSVRLTLSAACPAQSWKEFEKRFDLKIWEAYSSVDGGQNYIFNMGNAPVGSIGKPHKNNFQIVDDQGNQVKVGATGELLFKVTRDKKVKYFKNEKATRDKIKNGFLHTGDMVYQDKKGHLYFVGRKTESMRRRGENVSAYDVENVILKSPMVLECAAYAVPSSLGEDDIMCAVVANPSQQFDALEFKNWISDKLAKFAIPKYIRLMDELPKTSTHRVIKAPLVNQAVTKDTIDLENL